MGPSTGLERAGTDESSKTRLEVDELLDRAVLHRVNLFRCRLLDVANAEDREKSGPARADGDRLKYLGQCPVEPRHLDPPRQEVCNDPTEEHEEEKAPAARDELTSEQPVSSNASRTWLTLRAVSRPSSRHVKSPEPGVSVPIWFRTAAIRWRASSVNALRLFDSFSISEVS